MNKIFKFCTAAKPSSFAACPKNLEKRQYIDLIRGNYEKINFPIVFEQFEGRHFADILNTGYVTLFLISDRLKDLLVENQITGWKTYPILLLEKTGQEIPGYHGFSITGSCLPEDYSQSEIIEYRYVEQGPLVKHYKGYKVISNGDFDFFIPPQTLGFYISEKAASILKKNKITNLELIDIEEEEIRCKTVNPSFQG